MLDAFLDHEGDVRKARESEERFDVGATHEAARELRGLLVGLEASFAVQHGQRCLLRDLPVHETQDSDQTMNCEEGKGWCDGFERDVIMKEVNPWEDSHFAVMCFPDGYGAPHKAVGVKVVREIGQEVSGDGLQCVHNDATAEGAGSHRFIHLRSATTTQELKFKNE